VAAALPDARLLVLAGQQLMATHGPVTRHRARAPTNGVGNQYAPSGVMQTILGLLGFWVAGTEVKSIIKGSTMKHALGASWSIFVPGDIPGHDKISADLDNGQLPRKDSR
jgi:hypothetical protein